MAVSADLADFVVKRLSMFVLRSKVKVSIADDLVLVGVGGMVAAEALVWAGLGGGGDAARRAAYAVGTLDRPARSGLHAGGGSRGRGYR